VCVCVCVSDKALWLPVNCARRRSVGARGMVHAHSLIAAILIFAYLPLHEVVSFDLPRIVASSGSI
jgi:hypothetical protein